jgi:hypothetical protein
MKELQVLDVVRIGKEVRNGGDNYYIELLEKFDWLLEDQFQNLIKGFDWEALIESESQSKEPKPMHRSYPGSDIWECDNCGIKGDVHRIENHIPYCGKSQQQVLREE